MRNGGTYKMPFLGVLPFCCVYVELQPDRWFACLGFNQGHSLEARVKQRNTDTFALRRTWHGCIGFDHIFRYIDNHTACTTGIPQPH